MRLAPFRFEKTQSAAFFWHFHQMVAVRDRHISNQVDNFDRSRSRLLFQVMKAVHMTSGKKSENREVELSSKKLSFKLGF
jgi:hypothetical protein